MATVFRIMDAVYYPVLERATFPRSPAGVARGARRRPGSTGPGETRARARERGGAGVDDEVDEAVALVEGGSDRFPVASGDDGEFLRFAQPDTRPAFPNPTLRPRDHAQNIRACARK